MLGNVWAGLAGTLAIYLAWQLANLFRLEWWVRHRSYADPPDIGGVWGEVIAQVVRLHRRKRFHKQRFLQLLRQIQRSTAALPDGVVILNAQREIAWLNRTAAQLLELRGREDLGLRIDNLLRQPRVRALPAGGDFSTAAGAASRAAGAERYLSLQMVPYGEGQLLLLVRDVSRQMRLEAMRKDFVANASHELRSPLTVISGYLETLSQDPALDPELAGPIAEMRRQAERMTAIIHDLLELSKLEESDDRSRRAPRHRRRCWPCCARTCWRAPCIRAMCAVGIESDAQAARRGVGDSLRVLQSRRQRREIHPARRLDRDALVDGR